MSTLERTFPSRSSRVRPLTSAPTRMHVRERSWEGRKARGVQQQLQCTTQCQPSICLVVLCLLLRTSGLNAMEWNARNGALFTKMGNWTPGPKGERTGMGCPHSRVGTTQPRAKGLVGWGYVCICMHVSSCAHSTASFIETCVPFLLVAARVFFILKHGQKTSGGIVVGAAEGPQHTVIAWRGAQ